MQAHDAGEDGERYVHKRSVYETNACPRGSYETNHVHDELFVYYVDKLEGVGLFPMIRGNRV